MGRQAGDEGSGPKLMLGVPTNSHTAFGMTRFSLLLHELKVLGPPSI